MDSTRRVSGRCWITGQGGEQLAQLAFGHSLRVEDYKQARKGRYDVLNSLASSLCEQASNAARPGVGHGVDCAAEIGQECAFTQWEQRGRVQVRDWGRAACCRLETRPA